MSITSVTIKPDSFIANANIYDFKHVPITGTWVRDETVEYTKTVTGVKSLMLKFPICVLQLVEMSLKSKNPRIQTPDLDAAITILKKAKDGLGVVDLVVSVLRFAPIENRSDLFFKVADLVNPFKDSMSYLHQSGEHASHFAAKFISIENLKKVDFLGNIAGVILCLRGVQKRRSAISMDRFLVEKAAQLVNVKSLSTRITHNKIHLAKEWINIALATLGVISFIHKEFLHRHHHKDEKNKEIERKELETWTIVDIIAYKPGEEKDIKSHLASIASSTFATSKKLWSEARKKENLVPKWVFTVLSLSAVLATMLAHYHGRLCMQKA